MGDKYKQGASSPLSMFEESGFRFQNLRNNLPHKAGMIWWNKFDGLAKDSQVKLKYGYQTPSQILVIFLL